MTQTGWGVSVGGCLVGVCVAGGSVAVGEDGKGVSVGTTMGDEGKFVFVASGSLSGALIGVE